LQMNFGTVRIAPTPSCLQSSSINTRVTGINMKFRMLMQSAAAGLFALVMVSSAKADTFLFGPQAGTNVVFDDIREETTTTFSLFSGLNAYNDTLDFDAFNFRQTSLSAAPSIDSRLSFTVNAVPGRFVTSVSIQEVGSYTTINQGVAEVFLGGVATSSGGGMPQLSSNTITVNGAAGQINSDLWNATITFDNFHGGEQVFIDLDNRLSAFGTNVSDYAFIDKKLVLVTVATAVPEPSSLAFLMGCVGVVATRRKRRA